MEASNPPNVELLRRKSEDNLEKALKDPAMYGDEALLQASWDGQIEVVRRLSRTNSDNLNTAKWPNLVLPAPKPAIFLHS